MRKTKYLNTTYTTNEGTWTVSKIYLAANYSHGTRHNAYRYLLTRPTQDKKFIKKIAVSGSTMTKIARGLVDLERLADRKGVRETNYQFTAAL